MEEFADEAECRLISCRGSEPSCCNRDGDQSDVRCVTPLRIIRAKALKRLKGFCYSGAAFTWNLHCCSQVHEAVSVQQLHLS